jgi:hypothetical protein
MSTLPLQPYPSPTSSPLSSSPPWCCRRDQGQAMAPLGPVSMVAALPPEHLLLLTLPELLLPQMVARSSSVVVHWLRGPTAHRCRCALAPRASRTHLRRGGAAPRERGRRSYSVRGRSSPHGRRGAPPAAAQARSQTGRRSPVARGLCGCTGRCQPATRASCAGCRHPPFLASTVL